LLELAHAERPATPWSKQRAPSSGPARAIGGYSAGCVAGAARLPSDGPGFHVARPERNRVYGHPSLIALIRELAARARAAHLAALAIGDLGQPRGGPAPDGHASHQNGLDVDIWFAPLADGKPVSMIDGKRKQPVPGFATRFTRLLESFAGDPRVDRIFINPLLKQALCEAVAGERAWLGKLRPWWGHDDHFHVRLACPADSPACEPQAPLAIGDGCGELTWWLSGAADADRARWYRRGSRARAEALSIARRRVAEAARAVRRAARRDALTNVVNLSPKALARGGISRP
jgi:penicillin-insensitive murein endopeptidase